MSMAEKLSKQASAKKVTAILVFGAIALVFVFFGLPGKLGIGIGSAARVNDAFISVADFQTEEQWISQYYAKLFGGSMDLGSQRQLFQREAMERLIQAELNSQAAKKEGILVTDAEVRDYIIKDLPYLQEKGQFQREYYSRFLEMNRMKPADFESKIRKNIENIRLQKLFEIAARPSALEIEKLKEMRENQWNIAFVKLEDKMLADKMPISEAKATQALQQPEFAKKTEDYFNLHRNEYMQEEKIQAQHILIKAKKDDAASQAAALEKIKKIKAQSAKEDFGKLAALHSEDAGSKDKKGDLGFFGRGRMVKEFEDAAFSQAPGTISEPIKTDYGYHLIKVIQKTPAVEASYEKLKLSVAKKVLAEQEVGEKVKELESAVASKDMEKINPVVKSLGLNWDETGFFNLDADTIPKLQGQGLASAVYQLSPQNPLSANVIREGNARYILRWKESKKQKTTETENEDLAQRRRGQDLYMAWLNNFRKTAKIETNPQLLK